MQPVFPGDLMWNILNMESTKTLEFSGLSSVLVINVALTIAFIVFFPPLWVGQDTAYLGVGEIFSPNMECQISLSSEMKIIYVLCIFANKTGRLLTSIGT